MMSEKRHLSQRQLLKTRRNQSFIQKRTKRRLFRHRQRQRWTYPHYHPPIRPRRHLLYPPSRRQQLKTQRNQSFMQKRTKRRHFRQRWKRRHPHYNPKQLQPPTRRNQTFILKRIALQHPRCHQHQQPPNQTPHLQSPKANVLATAAIAFNPITV